MSEEESKAVEGAEAALKGKVDSILEGVASLDTARIADPQLKRIMDSLQEFGETRAYPETYEVMVKPGPGGTRAYPETYQVMVKPGPDERINPGWQTTLMARIAVPAVALFAGAAVILLLVLLLFAR